MPLQYIITGGQLYMEKTAFAREMLLAESPLRKLVYGKSNKAHIAPKVERLEERVSIDFNQAEVETEEGFYDIFRKMKEKYREKLQGRVVIRITALTSYYVTLNFNNGDEKVVYE